VSANALSPRHESRSEIEWYFRNMGDGSSKSRGRDTRLRFPAVLIVAPSKFQASRMGEGPWAYVRPWTLTQPSLLHARRRPLPCRERAQI
jgi:hypothetical protein